MYTPIVHIVGTDAAERRSLREWIASFGVSAREYERLELLVQRYDGRIPGCLLVSVDGGAAGKDDDLRLLQSVPARLPTVVVTPTKSVALAVLAMKAGAVDVLHRPLGRDCVHDAVVAAIEADARRRSADRVRDEVAARLRTLTLREQEVLRLVVEGRPNKTIAMSLHLSQKTVEVHRAHVMRKLQAGSVAELVRLYLLSQKAEAAPSPPPPSLASAASPSPECVDSIA